MAISYHDGHPRPEPALAIAFLLVNTATVLLVILGWPVLAETLAPAIEWAAAEGTGSVFDLRQWPYLLLWAMPMASCLLASIAVKLELWMLARILGAAPVLLLGCVLGWFYLLPPGWH